MKEIPSSYQQAIYDWVKDKNGSMAGAGIAVAGSGKTTTAVNSMGYIPRSVSVRFNCFAKIIRDELAKRVEHMLNVEVSTYNSFGWRVCREEIGRYIKLDTEGTKTANALRIACRGDEYRYNKYKGLIGRLVSLCKGMCYVDVDQAMNGLDALIDHHGLMVGGGGSGDRDGMRELFRKVYKAVIIDTSIMDYDDQLFMPIKLGLSIPKTDFLIVDEWQDTNLVQYELVKRSLGENSRVMVIGDPDQSIYGFRGSAPGIVDRFVEERNAKRLPLYICYRCSQAAVMNAKQWVPHIKAWEHAREGVVDEIKMDRFRERVTDDDMVLCRMNSPLISSVMWFLSHGRPAFVLGREVAEQLIGLIRMVVGDDVWMNLNEFKVVLNEWVEYRRSRLVALEKENAVQLLDDQVECISSIMESNGIGSSVQQLMDRITTIFQENGRGIKHMSIHKSKGLETTDTGSVYSLPYKSLQLRKEWMVEEEKRLKYVEATRTKNNHFYITGGNG